MSQFAKGNWVRYVPTHAHGDINHVDCQDGVVKRTNDDGSTVFVLFDCLACTMITGDEDYTAQGTNPADLVLMGEKRPHKHDFQSTNNWLIDQCTKCGEERRA